MSQFKIREEYLKLIEIVAEQNSVSHDEVVETALAMFFNTYFLRKEMYPELEIAKRYFEPQEMDPEEVKKKLQDDKSMVDAAIAEAERLGLI
ncbi:MAG: hypothetical protein PHO01_01095 [Desulfotomaculaceae bacterium]|nr:hypothetical protein [Desulfotomaculaceae bacterium]